MLTEQETTTRLFIAENHARELRAENANLLSLLRDLYDVATEQRILHVFNGICPASDTSFDSRDDECPACQVLERADVVLRPDCDGGGHAQQQERDEMEALRRDAARYRSVRRGQKWSVIDGVGNDLRGEDLDAAIDAAMQRTEAGGCK